MLVELATKYEFKMGLKEVGSDRELFDNVKAVCCGIVDEYTDGTTVVALIIGMGVIVELLMLA